MKRLLLFALFGGFGVWGLLRVSGGLDGPAADRPAPAIETATVPVGPADTTPAARRNPINVGDLGGPSVRTPGGENAKIMGKTETLSWTDSATGDVMEIRGWFTWRFETAAFEGLPQGNAATQGILCTGVVLELYREPLTHSEALRRIEGDLKPVLRQRFTATSARAFGSIAQKLNDRTGKRETAPGPDTRIRLLGDVVITDFAQGMRITGSDLLVYPVQERVEGTGDFRVEHEAMTLTGQTLAMERHERGWTRVEIQKKTALHLHSDVRDGQGKPMFNFGTGEFRPTHVLSDGRAIFIREQGRREERLRITFPQGVTATQEGGRRLTAGWLELLAIQEVQSNGLPDDEQSRAWALRDLTAEGGVRVEYPNESEGGTSFVTSIAAKRITHIVPQEGRPRTELYGDPRIVLRGQLPIDDRGSPEDRLHIACQDRAWIEPLTSAEVDPGLDAAHMLRLSLRGSARVERHARGPSVSEDILEGASIDLLLLEQPAKEKDGKTKTQTVAVQFSATGDVRLGGSRIRGRTQRLIAQGLHTEQPHIFAEGPGTVFTIPLVRHDQGLLGPERTRPGNVPAEAAAEAAADSSAQPGEVAGASERKKLRWMLQRLLARGDVVVETQLGGASVGIPTRVTALEVSYDADQGLARLNGRPGAPVRILSTVAPRETNLVEAQTMTLDRAHGVISARHGVRGELWVSEQGGLASAGGRKREPSRAREMSIRTDARIDLHLSRTAQGWQPELAQEQRLTVQGPLVAELKSENLTVDRMRARTLDIVLTAQPPAKPEPQSAASTPTARRSTPRSTTEPPKPARTTAPRSRVDVTARDVRIMLRDGEVSRLDASGGVDLKGRPGHVTGERLTYDATTHRIEITAGRDPERRPATAYLGSTESRTEIEGARLGIVWRKDGAQAADATAPTGRKSRIRLFRKDAKTPHLLERFELRYEGTVHLLPDKVRASRVVVIRSVRNLQTRVTEPSAALYTSELEVTGHNLLSREAVQITRMVAQGKGTYFRQGTQGQDLLEAWGQRFDYNVTTGIARLEGTADDEVVLKQGANESYFPVLLIDVAKGLPFAPDGTYIVLRKKKPK